MNPDTNQFEQLNGGPMPGYRTKFRIGEEVVIKNYTFRVAYIGQTSILFEPVGLPILDAGDTDIHKDPMPRNIRRKLEREQRKLRGKHR